MLHQDLGFVISVFNERRWMEYSSVSVPHLCGLPYQIVCLYVYIERFTVRQLFCCVCLLSVMRITAVGRHWGPAIPTSARTGSGWEVPSPIYVYCQRLWSRLGIYSFTQEHRGLIHSDNSKRTMVPGGLIDFHTGSGEIPLLFSNDPKVHESQAIHTPLWIW
jgi:hypothetical protein